MLITVSMLKYSNTQASSIRTHTYTPGGQVKTQQTTNINVIKYDIIKTFVQSELNKD